MGKFKNVINDINVEQILKDAGAKRTTGVPMFLSFDDFKVTARALYPVPDVLAFALLETAS